MTMRSSRIASAFLDCASYSPTRPMLALGMLGAIVILMIVTCFA